MKQAYEYLYKLMSTTLVQIREIFWSLEVCHYMLISENPTPRLTSRQKVSSLQVVTDFAFNRGKSPSPFYEKKGT
jgi:hypothetical protein